MLRACEKHAPGLQVGVATAVDNPNEEHEEEGDALSHVTSDSALHYRRTGTHQGQDIGSSAVQHDIEIPAATTNTAR